ncbi:polypeptide N-acetylgalactosaminyltransferase 10 [Biomphalaria pfeifferi]|uniref:Polypeptide N-acetylgalactosaminyltransferase n=1 Tax=Biomphalaria pfeifferi TaxID=112525 RepID=A0AAD8BBE3_BIOPF|nr:polypeptide N-acetylgalactosaminyltransferase 10 [Biomphalaria pfeifferi]
MGLFVKRHRWFFVVVVSLYFVAICVFLNNTVESDNFMKAIQELHNEVRSFGQSLQNSFDKFKPAPSKPDQEKANPNLVPPDVPRDINKPTNKTFVGNELRKDSHTFQRAVTTNAMELMDWNDYELMARDAERQGPGEHGRGFTQNLTAEELKIVASLKERYKYNAYASDHISLERSLNDSRTEVCKKKLYLKNLPENSVSFVTIFHNERNSTLLRTIHGIVNRSPKNLLREIVVVDDFSTNEELKAPLEEYIAQHFKKVRIIRNKQREGLIRSRIIGANQTTGSFLVFLDAHVEVNVNFLPPLIEPMVLDYRTIVCPMVDNTVDETLEVRGLIYRERGAFDWALVYHRLPVHQADESIPHNVTSMIGCAMAISRRWWEEIGMFDPGLEIWGGEQFEISFKSWMCGGRVVDAPCSRVAHVFRSLPYVQQLLNTKVDQRNLLRVALVWMDEYKEYFFQRRPALKTVDPGNLTSQYELRKRLNCKSFDWFMKEVAPDIPKYFPLVEPLLMAWGKIKSVRNNSLCISGETQSLSVVECSHRNASTFMYNWRLQVRRYDKCFCNAWGNQIVMWGCFIFEEKPTELFLWDRASGLIVNGHTKMCVDFQFSTFQLQTSPCNKTSSTQSWTFESYNATSVDSTWETHKHLLNMTLT